MPALDLPEVPAAFKSIQPYLKIATQHDDRDPVVSYWARLYAAQTALGLSKKKSPEETAFLIKLMTWLEETKKESHDNEAITNEVAAQAHLENWALKLFLYADKNDRESNFSKNVIQSFYTAGMLYDIITIFGELPEEAAQNRKYAKWKASYIHNCLKNGETPVPGPLNSEDNPNSDDDENVDETEGEVNENTSEVISQDDDNKVLDDEGDEDVKAPESPKNDDSLPSVPRTFSTDDGPSTPQSPSTIPSYPRLSTDNSTDNPAPGPTTVPVNPVDYSTVPQTGGVNLSSEQMVKAQKYIKWAGSAINYDDVPTAVDNLQRALRLLTTGEDS